MKSICFFISYTESDHRQDMPMIGDLHGLFTRLVVVSNKKVKEPGVETLVMPNLGYDFGFLYRALQAIDISGYEELAFINNSNVLVKSKSLHEFMTWGRSSRSNFFGITDSHEAPAGVDRTKSYHIQSHLLVFRGSAIKWLSQFWAEVRFDRFFLIKDQGRLRQTIINECEIGLTQFMLKRGEKPMARFNANVISVKYGKPRNINMHVHLWEELIGEGYPLIKKKIVSGEWRALLKNIENRHKYL
jgi:lipopolysaccharide biosynthesis protein